MKKQLFLLFAFISLVSAQDRFQQAEVTRIKRSTDMYYWGEGRSTDVNEARNHALQQISNSIAVRISSSLKNNIVEDNRGITEKTELVMQSHSNATLRNVKEIASQTPDGRIYVFAYIKRNEVDAIFEERRKLVWELTEQAQAREREGNVADALKLNYYALVLMNSIPDPMVSYRNTNYTVEIPRRINDIIRDTRFNYVSCRQVSEREREITLKVTSGSREASLADFTFWDGASQQAVQARDGRATFRLFGGSVDFDELKLNLEYTYFRSRNEIPEVGMIWDVVNKQLFDSQIAVALDPAKAVPVQKPVIESSVVAAQRTGNLNIRCHYEGHVPAAETIGIETRQFIEVISSGNMQNVQRVYGNDRFLTEKLTHYMRHNKPVPVDDEIQVRLAETMNGWEARSIAMLHRYPSINRQTTEYLVLDFDRAGRLTDINVSVTDALYKRFAGDAVEGEDEWGHKKEIMRFLEKYRTSYLTRDISMIDMMFAEDALIIVGRRIERKPLPDDRTIYQPFGNQPGYEYLRMKKGEYISRQRMIFNQQQDISLEFSTFDIHRKSGSPNVYSMQMRQQYNSTTYADEGYLFLLIDFNTEDPLIYVRAWQPNEWDREDLVDNANFRMLPNAR